MTRIRRADNPPGSGEGDDGDLPMHELDDGMLIQRLGAVIANQEPPPHWVVELGRRSYDMHRVDLDLELAVLDRGEHATAIRSAGAGDLLFFDTDELAVEIEISGSGDARRMLGELDPPGPARVEIRQPTGSSGAPGDSGWVEADEQGRFEARLAPGPVSVVVHRPGRRPTATEWV